MALNVEVVRGRAARALTETAALLPFADAAAEDLGRVTPLVEALLALARPPRVPVDLWMAVEPVIRLHAAVLADAHRALGVEPPAGALPPLSCTSEAARLAAITALNAFTAGSALRCTARAEERGSAFVVTGDAEPQALDAEVCAALAAAGIRMERTADAVTVRAGVPGGEA